MSGFDDIQEHMKVIGADGAPLGTVDRVEDNRIKLIRADSGIGHEEHPFASRGRLPSRRDGHHRDQKALGLHFVRVRL